MCRLIPTLDGCPGYDIWLYFVGIVSQGWLSREEFLKLACRVGLCMRILWFACPSDTFLEGLPGNVCFKQASRAMIEELRILIYASKMYSKTRKMPVVQEDGMSLHQVKRKV